MTGGKALEVQGLARAFGGFRAVDGVSFAVAPGEVVALIGPNGAGKTTTFNLVNGQLKPDRGRVLVAGREVTGEGPRRLWEMGVARTFQITATFATMSVRENLAVAVMAARRQPRHLFSLRRMPALDAPETSQLIADAGLGAIADRICATLAYGDLKRVELAVALANAPRLLLMDEPTAGMAGAERGALMELAVGAARARGAAILFTEHDMGVVFRHAERVLVMSRGKLIAEGPPDEIRANAQVREVYLGHVGAAPRGRS
ncbi:MAG: ABC transporter ATP-binding protein [Hyphomicrobiaceae bacterium]